MLDRLAFEGTEVMSEVHEKYEAVIGLEIHAQLRTQSKLFCACSTSFHSEPNTNICPVCTAQPGALPVLNKMAVEMAIKAGLSLHCSIQEKSVFARKNYFYPDLPKGYQISQYELPLCLNGYIDIIKDEKPKRVTIQRIHMEEDAGKLLHDAGHQKVSHVDLNRCSIPLIEIVSGPDIRTPQEAAEYYRTIRNILVYLEVSDGNMQEGSLRCDANVSIRMKGQNEFGTRTETKNVSSFKFVESAITYEINRQIDLIENGERVIQETRLWDSVKQETRSMRSKEEAHDYRYFPDPDLLPLIVDQKWIQGIQKKLPELATQKAERFVKQFGIPKYNADVLTAEKPIAAYFEKAVATHNYPLKISNWILSELMRELKEREMQITEIKVTPKQLGSLIDLIEKGAINGKIAKEIFMEMMDSGKEPETLIKEKGLEQVSDAEAIETCIAEILAKPEESVNIAKWKSGKSSVLGYFVGLVMKKMKGKGNPKIINDILRKKLDD